MERKHIIPKLKLEILSQQTDSLTSRETTAIINSHREIESFRAAAFSSARYSSKRPQLWSSSALTSPNNKIWNDSDEKLYKQVSELTLKLDDIQKGLTLKTLSFDEAGKLLSEITQIRCRNHAASDDDLIFCLDLVEQLWECVNNDGLSCNEFSALLSNMLQRPASEFEVLFQKMDADGDETLSWGEYVSFLSQQQAHLWDQQESKNISYFKENFSSVYNCTGNHMFHKLCIMNGDKELTNKCTVNSAKYALLTSDNSIQIRNALSLALESTIDMSLRPRKKKIKTESKYRSKPRAITQDKYITTCTNICCIHDKLAVSFMDRAVNIYTPSVNAPKDMVPIYLQAPVDRKRYNNKLHYHLEHGFFALDIPQCVEVFSESDGTLLVGETYGTIGLYNYRDNNCLARVHSHKSGSGSGPCVVKQIKKVERIGVVSAAMDNLINVTDSTKWCKVRTLSGHTRGVYSIAFSVSHRMLVSAGYDRKIIVWDPYVPKPLGLLKGHLSCVVQVLINEQANQIITASMDKKIKIWDVRTWKCLQTIRDNSIHSPMNQLTSIAFDPYQSCLITAGSKIRKWFVQTNNNNNSNHNDNITENIKRKLPPIVSICYSNIFKQIISIHIDETCILWDIQTGQNSFEFKMNHDSDSITTAAIDEVGKRLLTATQNGVIKMWNFNNGAVMHEFDTIEFEITKLIYLPRTLHCVVACGYNPAINRYPSHLAPPEANFILQNKFHKTDVRAMCITNDSLLSGSADGTIVEWHIDSNVKLDIFHCKAPYVSITAMCVANSYLFVGTEEGVVHIFEKEDRFTYVTTIKDEYAFKEAIVHIAVNEKGNRVMIADCDTMKLFDCKIEATNIDYILIKQWEPHKHGCIVSLLYIPGFDVFCSSSDNGELILWNADGIFLGQFGSSMTAAWNLSLSQNVSVADVMNKENDNDNDDNEERKDMQNWKANEEHKELKSPRKSYFDDHVVYKPKFIKSVVTESIARTLLEEKEHKKPQEKGDKPSTGFEQTLDKLMSELMKPKKKKKYSRRSTLFAVKPQTQRKSGRMKLDYYPL